MQQARKTPNFATLAAFDDHIADLGNLESEIIEGGQ